MLPLRLLAKTSSIWEVAEVLLGVLRGRFGFDLGSKIEMSTRISEIQESMLSPAWEHDFPMVCRCFQERFWCFGDDFHALGWFFEVSEVIWRAVEA